MFLSFTTSSFQQYVYIIDGYFKDAHLVGDGFQHQVMVTIPTNKANNHNREDYEKVVADNFDVQVKKSIDSIAHEGLDDLNLQEKVHCLDSKSMEV